MDKFTFQIDDTDNLPKCYCYECAAMLHKFHKFKEKCFIGDKVLKQLLWKGPVSFIVCLLLIFK